MSLPTTPARRTLAAGAAFALGLMLTACGSSTDPSSPASGNAGDQTSTLNVGATPSLSGLGLRVALHEKEFESRGLTVTPVPNKSANSAVPALLNGQLQIAQVDTLTFLVARSQGLPIKVIAGMGQQATNGEAGEMSAASVVSKPGSDIKGAADLVGKKVGVPAIKTQTWMNIRAIVDAAGGDSSKIEFVEVPPAQMIDLLSKGSVDAATPTEPVASGAIAGGKAQLVHSTDAPGNKGAPSSVYVATEEFIGKNPDTLDKFTAALYAAATKSNGDRALATKVAVEQLKLKPEQLTNAFFQPSFTQDVTPELIDKVATLGVKYGILTAMPDAADLLRTSN